MRVDTPPGPLEYEWEGGYLRLSLLREAQGGAERLEVRMCCYERAEGNDWQVIYGPPGETELTHGLGRYVSGNTWHTVRTEIRRTWVRVAVDGKIFGTAPFSLPLDAPACLEMSATSGDAHVDYVRVAPATVLRPACEFE